MVPEASSIDPEADVEHCLRYQQTLFDLSEIYARRFRKALKENRRKIIFGVSIAQELNTQIMTEFLKRRIFYDDETNSGSDPESQQEWELQIQEELEELHEFAFEE